MLLTHLALGDSRVSQSALHTQGGTSRQQYRRIPKPLADTTTRRPPCARSYREGVAPSRAEKNSLAAFLQEPRRDRKSSLPV